MTRTPRFHAVWLLALAAGCSAETSEGLDAQELTRVDEAGADGDCENGGVQISSGLDENKDGKLDDDEVTDMRVVCAGDTLADPENPETLRRVDALAVGSEECPAGGVAIHTGLDDDRNRELSDAEIDDTQTVCNDPDHAILTRSSSIPVGSNECVYGGKRVDIGADDGSGAATADDAVLADGEVETSYLDCNESQPDGLEPITPPAEPAASAAIDLRGGAGANAAAGAGGAVAFAPRNFSGCMPAITKLFTTGAADASFSVPALTIDLGQEPFVVSGNVTLEYLEGNNNPVAGRVYYSANSGNHLVRYDNPSSIPIITGLRIPAGASLTLPGNSVTLQFSQDVEIAGTLAVSPGEARGLNLTARQLVVAGSGVIDIPQNNSPAGTIQLFGNAQLQFLGTLNAQGTEPGLSGANVNMDSSGRVILGGAIHVSGADGGDGFGAPGGNFGASSYQGGVWSSAAIDADGGDGTAGGAVGGTIRLGYDDLARPLDLRNTGRLSAQGGAQTAGVCEGACAGGGGGELTLFATLANLVSSGELDADGGDGVIAAGNGGRLSAAILSFGTETLPDARLSMSGALSARGGAGAGAGGGGGGSLALGNCTGDESVAELLGYSQLFAQGGAASMAGSGGGGGSFDMTSTDSSPTPRRLYSNVPMDLSGGDGANAGAGGRLTVNLSFNNAVTRELPEGLPSLVIAGAHDASGGTARTGIGGEAGFVFLSTRSDLIATGTFITSAGDSVPTQFSPSGGTIALQSSLGSVLNGAALTASGANVAASQSLPGGNGGCIVLAGRKVKNEAALVARGGNGPAGGSGGNISLTSYDTPADHTGSFDVAGGSGTPAGSSGLAGFDGASCLD